MNELKPPGKFSFIPAIWIFPVILIVLESLVFITKHGWRTHDAAYYISFWLIRICLTPLVVYYTCRFWVEHTKKMKLALIHLAGFIWFSLSFTGIAYLLLHRMLLENDFPFLT